MSRCQVKLYHIQRDPAKSATRERLHPGSRAGTHTAACPSHTCDDQGLTAVAVCGLVGDGCPAKPISAKPAAACCPRPVLSTPFIPVERAGQRSRGRAERLLLGAPPAAALPTAGSTRCGTPTY